MVEETVPSAEALAEARAWMQNSGRGLPYEYKLANMFDRFAREKVAEFMLDKEGHQTPCLSALASGDACQPDKTLKRCGICGFVVDTKFAAERPTVRMRP